MKDSDLREARRCLANEETCRAKELYKHMLGDGEIGSEAELAIKLCNYYEACQSGTVRQDPSSRDELFLCLCDLSKADFEFSLIFPPLAVKALRMDPFTFKNWLFIGTKDRENLLTRSGKMPKRSFSRYTKKIPYIIEVSRYFFLGAVASEQFDALPEDEKKRYWLEAIELDKLFINNYEFRQGELHAPNDEQMTDIYRKVRRLDARVWQCLKMLVFYISFPVVILFLFWYFVTQV